MESGILRKPFSFQKTTHKMPKRPVSPAEQTIPGRTSNSEDLYFSLNDRKKTYDRQLVEGCLATSFLTLSPRGFFAARFPDCRLCTVEGSIVGVTSAPLTAEAAVPSMSMCLPSSCQTFVVVVRMSRRREGGSEKEPSRVSL